MLVWGSVVIWDSFLQSPGPQEPSIRIDLYSSVVSGLRPRWLKPCLGVKGVGKASPEMVRAS